MIRQDRQPRAIGYVRVSTRDQADKGHSLDAQRAKIEAYATLHDLDLSEVIVDDGHSAKSLDRPGMARLLDTIRRRQTDCVVIAKLDRITRSVRDLGELVELFQRSGVEFASVNDNIDTSTASGRLVLNVMASVSQWEREAIGERTSEALAHMRANGQRVSHHATFGYRLENGAQVEDAHEQEAIGLMRDLRGQGMSCNRIGKTLAKRGYLGRRGRAITSKTVAAVLRRAEEG